MRGLWIRRPIYVSEIPLEQFIESGECLLPMSSATWMTKKTICGFNSLSSLISRERIDIQKIYNIYFLVA